MGSPSRIIVLAEDQRHQRFVHRYLERLGVSLRDIYFEPLPAGRGCGEQWVRERYSKNVRAYRARAVRAETALVVAIDADLGDLARRIQQLEAALVQARQAMRNAEEKISHLIPKRNIETWILCLMGGAVDEGSDYRHANGIDESIKPSAEMFFRWSRPGAQLPAQCVDSLRRSIPEIRRLEI